MSDWLFDLPLGSMALLVFGVACFIAASIYAVVVALAAGERASVFKAALNGGVGFPGFGAGFGSGKGPRSIENVRLPLPCGGRLWSFDV
jgi:hypothetical protein